MGWWGYAKRTEFAKHRQNDLKLGPKLQRLFLNWIQKVQGGTKIVRMEAKGAHMEPKWHQKGVRMAKEAELKRQRNTEEGGLSSRLPHFSRKMANMAPTWLPKWSQNCFKIWPKIDQHIDGSWD